ncbi:Alanine racemase [Brevinematales bacterium NS]|nr:alanine racemase [Brevinematales bacterium]QJR22255.1 Alanine racemase [Brevinematales bacterium NS]
MFATESFRPTWVEIDLSSLRKNAQTLLSRTGGKPLIAVVKADAYGHGAVRVAKALEKEGVNFFAVATLDEAIELRENGVNSDILILGPVEERGMDSLFTYRLVATVISSSYAKSLSEKAKKQGQSLRVHVKIDTGMGRLGIRYDEAPERLEEIMSLEGLFLEGIFSHFPSADVDRDFSEEQVRRLKKIRENMRLAGKKISLCHIANSEGIWNIPSSFGEEFTHVRPGISLYGVASSERGLLPVMSLRTKIVQIKPLRKKETVSYLRQYVVQKEREYIAVLPLGYADGVSTCGSGKYEVVIKGRRYPQVGRVCMDYMMVSLDDNPDHIEEGTEVEVFGSFLSLQEFAHKSSRIPYEVMCGVSKRVPRWYKGEE